ncbi:MAG: hypothetical protein H6710_06420 [Myxococcales bacterium]|nr:hypothetical protein [Myxococcales bacterium]MCB9704572.1 hypothetical protein [Myxococcales bacterium]
MLALVGLAAALLGPAAEGAGAEAVSGEVIVSERAPSTEEVVEAPSPTATTGAGGDALRRLLLQASELPPGYFLSDAVVQGDRASQRWAAGDPAAGPATIEVTIFARDDARGWPPPAAISEGLPPLEVPPELGPGALYGGTPALEDGGVPSLTYIFARERGPLVVRVKVTRGTGSSAPALMPIALRGPLHRLLVHLDAGPPPDPPQRPAISAAKLHSALLGRDELGSRMSADPRAAPDGPGFARAMIAAGALASAEQAWLDGGGEAVEVAVVRLVDRRASFARPEAAQEAIAARLAADPDFIAHARHIARKRAGPMKVEAESDDDMALTIAVAAAVRDAEVRYTIVDRPPYPRRLLVRPLRLDDGTRIGGRYLVLARAGAIAVELEAIIQHPPEAAEAAGALLLGLADQALAKADALQGPATPQLSLAIPEDGDGDRSLRTRPPPRRGASDRRQQIRDYWRHPPRGGPSWIGFHAGAPIGPRDIAGVPIRSRYTFGIDVAALPRPRIHIRFAYRRSAWRTVGVDPTLDLGINRLEIYYGLPLIALPWTWRVRPELFALAGVGMGWAVSDFKSSNGDRRRDPGIGGGGILGAEAALDVRFSERVDLMLRGGVLRGFYAYAEDHLAERSFADAISWYAGAAVGLKGF